MTGRVRVLEVDLGSPPEPPGDLGGYRSLWVLVRLHGTPIGRVQLPVPDGGMGGEDLRRVVIRGLEVEILRHHLSDLLARPLPKEGVSFEELLDAPHPEREGPLPLVTAAVCTRDRPADLKLCLDALLRLDYPNLDLLVVDNAPGDDRTERLVGDAYPGVRYVREPRPGLDWARNRAIAEARGEIVAYTDDDAIADPGWVSALVAAFEDPQVMAVTGLVMPYELETEAQVLFQQYGGFNRGFKRGYWRIDRERGERPLEYMGAGRYGTGANMAYRRSLFERIGTFDPALDVGTVTNGGGDLEMFFRVLQEGHLLVYEPAAMVLHRHRRDRAALRAQIANNGVGFYSYLVRTALAYPEARVDAVRFGLWWFWWWSLRRLLMSFVRPARCPRDLIWAELWGALVGLARYPVARRRAARIAASFGDEAPAPSSTPAPPRGPVTRNGATVGVRIIDLHQPLRGLDDVADHAGVRVFLALGEKLIGKANIDNHHQQVSKARLREAVVDQLGLGLLGQDPELWPGTLWDSARAALRRRYLPAGGGVVGPTSARLPGDVPVSVVVATHDRPDDLRRCLSGLTAQETARPVEIVVVDNHPASGLTPPVVAEFPRITLVAERRQGLSYARNKGFTKSRGEILIAVDDDVAVPPDWLERLVAPFVRPDVMVVTGNVLPLELGTAAQRHFERYGGLGRGFVPKEVAGEWFASFRRRAVPTWDLGATANAAFRAEIFAHPEIGLLDETLGAGTPTGCSEDTYLFYKVLKAGYTIAYEPSAYVWHRHRPETSALRNQLYNYSKGHVAYHLTTLLRDRDVRVVPFLTVVLPGIQLKRLAAYAKRRLLRRDRFPLGLLLLEIRGNLAAPWALWLSYRRVKREGRSDPYVPVHQRSGPQEKP